MDLQDREAVLAAAFGDALKEQIAVLVTNIETERRQSAGRMAFLQEKVAELERRLANLGDRALTDNGVVKVVNEARIPHVAVTNEVSPAQVNVEAPTVNVVNEVHPNPSPITINCDMTPVADSLSGMAGVLAKLSDTLDHQREMLSQLLQVLAETPAPTVKPIIRVVPSMVTLTPDIKLTLPPPDGNGQRKRTLRVDHSDGTSSWIQEE